MSSKTPNPSIFGTLVQKVKEKPFFYIGTASWCGIAAYGLYGLKTRKIRMSLYLINLRLAAQGSFCVILTGGAAYLLSQRYFKKEELPAPQLQQHK